MSGLTVDSCSTCTRWVMLAGVLASVVAAFMLLDRFGQPEPAVSEAPEESDEINGM